MILTSKLDAFSETKKPPVADGFLMRANNLNFEHHRPPWPRRPKTDAIVVCEGHKTESHRAMEAAKAINGAPAH
jgi:hypothetical protein